MALFMEKCKAWRSPAILANIAMIVTMVAWGTSFISTKIALREMPPFTIAFIRFALTSLMMYAALRQLEPRRRLKFSDVFPIAMAGLLGITVYFCLENMGIKFTTASNASLIASVTPILSIALNMAFFRARLSICEFIGVIIGVIGAYLTVTAHGSIDFSSDNFKGNMFMVGAMISWAFYTVLSKKLQGRYSGMFLVTWQTIFATVLLIPAALCETGQWREISLLTGGQILYLATICSGLGYFFYIYALKELDVVVTTLYLNLVPVVGVISGYFILDERILPVQIMGGAIIVLAILIVNFDNTRRLFKNS